MPVGDSGTPVPLLKTEFNERDAKFSPDQHWIAYVSDESGRDEVYVRPFNETGPGATSRKWQLSEGGGVVPRWRRDGKELFYATPDDKLMAVSVKSGSTFMAGNPTMLFNMGGREKGSLSYAVRSDGQEFFVSRVFERFSGPVNVWVNWRATENK